MTFKNILLYALWAATGFKAARASLAARNALYHNKRSDLDNIASNSTPPHKHFNQPSRPVPNTYLNSKTKPYWVDGAALPEVDFNIGETYAGNLPIDDTGKTLFFWFVPSENPAASDEITLWLNGGPGCSSLDGFFHEQGPVIWQAGTFRPVPNTWTWANLTNIVFVDQPVGTGFSTGKPNATGEHDVAEQFRPFWKNFMDLFDLHGRKVYITGESYAGMYCPYITAGMLDQNDTEYFNVKGMMIYDPSIQYTGVTSEVSALPFAKYNSASFPLNNTFLAEMERRQESCGYNAYNEKALTFPPAGHFEDPVGTHKDGYASFKCSMYEWIEVAIQQINPCWDVYQVGQLCPLLWDVLGFPSVFYLPVGYPQPYFNRTDVKKVIHAPEDINWMICADKPVFPKGDKSLPSGHNGGPLMQVIEATNNVIVGHGAIDMILIANGTLITLNNLTWNGKQGFTSPPTKPFYVPYHHDQVEGSIAGAGIFGGWTERDGLTFVAVDLSGHEIPEYQPSAAYRTLEKLLGRISSLSEDTGFTTGPRVPQPNKNGTLGQGNWWPTKQQAELPGRR